jgi:hypothetical protein
LPGTAALGNTTSTSSVVTGNAGGAPASGGPASAAFDVVFLTFSKSMAAQALQGALIDLQFNLVNPDVQNAATGLSFDDDLDAFLPGAVAVGLPMNTVCGAGSTLTGTSLVTLTNGSLPAGGNCTFTIQVQIPNNAIPGNYTNQTSSLQAIVGGSPVNGGAAGLATAGVSVQSATAIPTLSPFALLALIGLLLGLGVAPLRP